jgi:hypothetical protein
MHEIIMRSGIDNFSVEKVLTQRELLMFTLKVQILNKPDYQTKINDPIILDKWLQEFTEHLN